MSVIGGWRRPPFAAGLAACLALAAGCGGGGSDSSDTSAGASSDTSSTAGTGGDTGKHFANFRAVWAPPDYMDPGLSYTTSGWQVMWNTYLGLLTYKHDAGP